MLEPIKVDERIRAELSKKIDKRLLKTKKVGGQELTYISQNTCVDILNDIFGHNWSMKIIDHWMEPGYDQIIKEQTNFKTKQKTWPNYINPPQDQIKTDGTGTRYVEVPQLPSAWCIVELSVTLKDKEGKLFTITKQGFGSQSINGNQSVQSQNGYKGAQSDALKKAATLLGIALELYRDPNEANIFDAKFKELLTTWGKDGVIEENKELWEKYTTIRDENGWTDDDTGYFVELVTNGAIDSVYDMPIELTDELISAMIEEE